MEPSLELPAPVPTPAPSAAVARAAVNRTALAIGAALIVAAIALVIWWAMRPKKVLVLSVSDGGGKETKTNG